MKNEIEYTNLSGISGPLIFVEGVRDVGFGEIVEIRDGSGSIRIGQTLEVDEERAVVQVFEGTSGPFASGDAGRCSWARSLEMPVSTATCWAGSSTGWGGPSTALPRSITDRMMNVNGLPDQSLDAREYPRDFIQTGISAIDGMNTLIRGQKLPIFSGSGMPHNLIAAQIARQATILTAEEEFTVIFAAMGVKFDVANFFIDSLEESGRPHNSAIFLSLADAPSIERLITPRAALTLAEHLAFDEGMHVLVILTDMTNYCEALRELSSSRGEIPSRKGYPGYLYSDLASIYERAGRIKGKQGLHYADARSSPCRATTSPIPSRT